MADPAGVEPVLMVECDLLIAADEGKLDTLGMLE
jgi:hypothetical protein